MKNKLNILSFAIIFLMISACSSVKIKDAKTISPELKWSERMALTLMKNHPESWQIDDNKKPQWDYVHGLVLTGFEKLYQKTNDIQYFNFVKSYADSNINNEGTIATYDISKYNIDMIESGNILFLLYEKTKDAKYLTAMQTLRTQLENQPRTSEGGFWHKKTYPNQMWLDGLYMGEVFYSHYTSKFEKGKQLDDVAKQFEIIQEHLVDSKTGLLYHGWDESKKMAWANKTTGTSPNFWSRSLGWYAMALVDILDYFPENHPKRAELISYLNQLAPALAKQQDKSGMWFQVTDQGNRAGNYLEASGTAMFAYAFAKGANKNYLPKSYKTLAVKAFDGMTRDLVKVDENGLLTITNVCSVAGLGGNPYRDGSYDYYVNEKRKDNDPKATGPFILAALELNK